MAERAHPGPPVPVGKGYLRLAFVTIPCPDPHRDREQVALNQIASLRSAYRLWPRTPMSQAVDLKEFVKIEEIAPPHQGEIEKQKNRGAIE
jgi:hypothetical protein